MFVKSFDGVSLYVKTSENDKEPLLFIHGGPGAWSYSFEHFAYDHIKEFANGIYYDQRGCGRSGGDEKTDYSMDAMVKDIESIRKELGIKKLNLFAHSFGGVIAINYILKYKKHVKKLIFSNATLSSLDSIKDQVDYGTDLLGEEPASENVIEAFLDMYPKLAKEEIIYKLQYQDIENYNKVQELDKKIENHSFAQVAFNMEEYIKPYYDLTKKIKIPTLVITGKNDFGAGPEHHKNFKFKNAEYVELDTKHVPFIENQEEYFSLVKNFLKK